VGLTLGVAYGGAVWDSTLDFGGYGDGDLNTLKEGNRWWDVVICIGDVSAEDAVARVQRVKSWDGDTLAAVVRAGATSGLWPREVSLIGWPARCVWGAKGGPEDAERIGLMEPPEWVQDVRYVRQPLPTRVWWPGMLADVGFFGGAAALLLAGPGAATRWRRRRRGACLGCGYDVRGVTDGVCPECGEPA